ncbi:LOW QUALITY PROTEIN: formyl peptide receptor-related sequence 4-like [Meriones unguiculatus]|uniref:LOW QUALITY PROTEIN: formyl peptide receptor-related sequence 4-like n=1 Tax=Meriones unguiculatus TaxID=10047 RepID=UPI00293E035D|nr:LOW QUALITY PROTEIN: formyl peptide receptor-related sequence 4-like [Meriones unguiculatus]
MEDPVEMQQPAPLGTLYLPWAILSLLYSLVAVVSYLLDMVSHSLLAQTGGSLLPAPLSAAWFGHQLIADIIFLGLLPLSLIWTHTCWLLGLVFCHLDLHLAFLTFCASGRLLAHVAADHCTSLLQPSWALSHHIVRQIVIWAGGFWILLLGLAGRALGTLRNRTGQGGPFNRTLILESLRHDQDLWAWNPMVDQLVFGFGVPLGILSAFHRMVQEQLRLARVSGRPPLLGLPGATAAMLFICWFPFHLLLLLRFLDMWGSRLQLGDVWVLLRPLGLTLLGSTSFFNPLLYVCMNKDIRGRLGQPLWFPGREGDKEAEEPWALGMEAKKLCDSLREKGTVWAAELLSSENVGWAEMKAQVIGREEEEEERET